MKEIVDKIRSAHLNNERTVWIREPMSSAGARTMTVFLDAELYRDRVGASRVIDELEAEHAIADSWFVFVSTESVEARWRECPCHPPFARFVREELMPWLEARCGKSKPIDKRILAGLSYTGLAASFVAKECPALFQKVIAQSGSFWFEECRLVDDFRALRQPLPTEFYLDVGTRETQVNVEHRENVLQRISQIEGVRRFRDVLLETGHAVKYLEFQGAHESAGWRSSLPEAIKWALPT